MDEVVYRIVEHDGGWAYKLGDVFSETFRTRADAEAAATRVAAEQRTPGETEAIEWQDADYAWHQELEEGSDRPAADVERGSGTSLLSPAPEARPSPPRASRRQDGSALTPVLLVVAIGAVVAMLSRLNRKRA